MQLMEKTSISAFAYIPMKEVSKRLGMFFSELIVVQTEKSMKASIKILNMQQILKNESLWFAMYLIFFVF